MSGAVDSAHGADAQGSAGLAAYKTQPRTSVMGEKCRLPLVYGCAAPRARLAAAAPALLCRRLAQP